MPVDDSYTSLIQFSDSEEQETVLGPLFATAAKANVAVFGRDKFVTSRVKQNLVNGIRAAIHSGKDPVFESTYYSNSVDRDGTPTKEIDTSENETPTTLLARSGRDQVKKVSNHPVEESRLTSSDHEPRQEMDEQPVTGTASPIKSQDETRDNIMVRRAVDGYLFDCAKNVVLLKADEGLRQAWSWIKSMFRRRCHSQDLY